MEVMPDGAYIISDEISIDGNGASNLIFSRGWLLEILELSLGEYFFFSDGEEVRPASRHFGVFYPAFTIVRSYVKNIKGKVNGIGSVNSFPSLPAGPIIFDTEFGGPFTDLKQAAEVLGSAGNIRTLEINTSPSLLSIKAKRLIDANFLVYPSISKIARRLNVSPEHMSRQFKRDYGLCPSSYLHQLRVSEATFRLAVGEEIIEISHEVGYNDLSRFYKQFRKATDTSPAACRSSFKK